MLASRKHRSRLSAICHAARIETLEPRQMLAAPDLTAAILTLDTTVARGHQMAVDFRITNGGDAPTALNWTDRIWLSATPAFDSKAAIDLGIWGNGDVATLPLAPGNSYQTNRIAYIPATLATGTWYVFVEADRWSEVAELDETNNISPSGQITLIAPDIAMSKASIISPPSPYDVTWGQKIDVSFTVDNKTAARLDGYWFDAVVASKDNKLDLSDYALAYIAHEPLAPFGSYTHTPQVSIDGPWALSSGPGYLLVVANHVEWSSPDADRSDNVIAIPITVRAPDLQVTASALDDKGTPITPANLVPTGTSVNVAYTVANTGDAGATVPWHDTVYISKKNVFDNAAQWLGDVPNAPPPGTLPLAAAGTYNGSFSIDTTAFDGGDYYVFVKADSGFGLMEASDDNNVSPAMPLHLVAPNASPDLTIDNLVVTPNTGNIGSDTLTITYDIHNVDPVNPTTADYWFDTLWLSRTPTFDRAVAIWANTLFDNPPVIGPGGTYSFSTTIPLPTNVGLGTFYVYVETDVFNWQQEKDGGNNVTTQNDVTLDLHGADFNTSTLTIDNGSGDINNHDIPLGSSFTVNWHVDNIGDIDTPADWIDAVYVSDLWYLDQTAIRIGEFSTLGLGLTTPIAAGGGYDASGTITIPAWLGTGNKNVFVVSGLQSTGGGDGNSMQYQPDSNIYNNTYGGVQVQVRQADLAITAAAAGVPSAGVGDLVNVTWSVINNGDAVVAPGWVDRVYISTSATFNEQTARPLYWVTHNFPLGGQGSGYGTGVDVDTTGLDGGNYFLFVVTDADHTLTETNESNNVSSAIPLTLVPAAGLPDLTASINSVAPNPAVGNIGVDSIEVTYTISNLTAAATDGNGWNDAVWLSPTPAFNPATAIPLGSFWNSVATVPAGAHYTRTTTVYLPSNVGLGTFYLFVQADVDSFQLESNGANNLSPAVQALPVELHGPDLVVTGTSFNNYTGDPNNHLLTLNNTFELGWTIENQGDAESALGWVDAIYVSDSPIWDPPSARLVTQFNALDPLPLVPLGYYEPLYQLSLPGWVGAGLHFLYVVTGVRQGGAPSLSPLFGESGSSITFEPDADFASNVSGPIRVNVTTPNVDLTVTIDSAPVAVTPGQYVTTPLDWTVTNHGSDFANGNTNTGQNWVDVLYLTQTPDDPASYIYLASYDTAYTGNTPLGGTSSYTASFNGFDIPFNITPGNWYFVLVTDSNNDQGETSDANNTAVIPVLINLIDLTTPSVTVTPAAGTIGQTSLHVTWTVHNGGDADSVGGWSDVIYVSTSPVFDGSAVQLTSVYQYDVLAQGADYIGSTDIVLPGGIGAGALYIYVVADGYNYIPETDEDNNASAGFPITVSGADLQVTASQITSIAPLPAVVNGTVSISWTVRNAGNTPTTATYWYDTVYISDNPVYGQGNRWLVYTKYIAAGELDTGTLPLAPGASYTAHLNNIVIPGAAGVGDRYLYVVSDAYIYYYNTQPETNENNNAGPALPITLSAPDLVVSAASSDSKDATVGGSVTVHWTVTNDDKNGASPAQGSWYDRIYLSNDTVLGYDDTSIFNRHTSLMSPVPTPLDAGKSYTNTAAITIPSNASAGANYLIFVTDADDDQGEDDNTNNTAVVPITLNVPDLAVSSVSGPPSTVVNGQVTLTWTTQNMDAYTAHGPWYDAVYLSDDAVFDPYSDTYIGAALTGSLPPGTMPLQPAGSVDGGGNPTDRYTMTRSFDMPYYLPLGARYMFIVADYYNAQTEADETNNTRMLPITLVAPDLTVVSPSGPSSAIPGDNIAITWTTQNLGAVPAYGPWYDAVYISDDNTFGNLDDRFLGYYYANTPTLPLQPAGSVSGGNPTDRYTLTRNFTIPADMSGGIKHVFIKADGGYYYWFGSVYGDNIQGETDDTNNVAAFTIDLGGGSPPVIDGTSADDTLYLRRSGDGLLIEAFVNTPTSGAPTWVYGLGASIAFNGLNGNDTLTLDFSNGNPIPSLGVAFDGGGGTDALLVTKPTAATALTVYSGSLYVAGNSVTHTSAEQVALDGPADSVILLGSLILYDNLSVVAGKNLTVRLSLLSISAAVSLDMADNDLILDYAGTAPLATVRQWLHNGQMGTAPSIRTSTPSPSPTHLTTLALADNALLHLTFWAGHLLTASSNFSQLIIKHTYAGDTDMDGRVTRTDYLNVLANMGSTNSLWFNGDLNHDGIVSPDDLALVSLNLGAGDSGPSGPSLAAAAVTTAASPKVTAKTATAKKLARKSHKTVKSLKGKPHLAKIKVEKLAKHPKRHAS